VFHEKLQGTAEPDAGDIGVGSKAVP